MKLACHADRCLSRGIEAKGLGDRDSGDRDSIGVIGGLRVYRSDKLAPVSNEVRVLPPNDFRTLKGHGNQAELATGLRQIIDRHVDMSELAMKPGCLAERLTLTHRRAGPSHELERQLEPLLR